MASHGKKKTTMAKLNREARLRERRVIKEANKRARQQQRNEPPVDGASLDDPTLQAVESPSTDADESGTRDAHVAYVGEGTPTPEDDAAYVGEGTPTPEDDAAYVGEGTPTPEDDAAYVADRSGVPHADVA